MATQTHVLYVSIDPAQLEHTRTVLEFIRTVRDGLTRANVKIEVEKVTVEKQKSRQYVSELASMGVTGLPAVVYMSSRGPRRSTAAVVGQARIETFYRSVNAPRKVAPGNPREILDAYMRRTIAEGEDHGQSDEVLTPSQVTAAIRSGAPMPDPTGDGDVRPDPRPTGPAAASRGLVDRIRKAAADRSAALQGSESIDHDLAADMITTRMGEKM